MDILYQAVLKQYNVYLEPLLDEIMNTKRILRTVKKCSNIPINYEGYTKPLIKTETDCGTSSALAAEVLVNKMKRAGATSPQALMGSAVKTPKYVIQSGSSSTASTATSRETQFQSLGVAINSLPPNTIIKATTRPVSKAAAPIINTAAASTSTHQTVSAAPRVSSAVRQAVFIKRDMPQRTMRSMTLTLIENASLLHLGVHSEHMTILKRIICRNVTHLDCCITLRKLRQNEPFALLAEYFELSEADVEETFKRTLIRLARAMRPLICWPSAQHYYDRLKHTSLDYRANLLHVRSLIECVETDIWKQLDFSCSSYKFILCISTNGIISYISPAFPGECDDLQLFEATNFHEIIPNYLALCAEPGQAVQRERRDPQLDDDYDEDEIKRESRPALTKFEVQRFTGELAQQQSLSIIDGCLTSKRVPNMQLPTLRNSEPVCRLQMRDMIDTLREFKILEHNAIQQKSLLGYLNELLIVVAGLCNLKTQGL